MPETFDLENIPVHLGPSGSAHALEPFDGTPEWYARYGERFDDDGPGGRLLTVHTFDSSWTAWEMHPAGDEVVVCTAGELTLVQEIDGDTVRLQLSAGGAAINPAGVWHTADVDREATVLFVTPGLGTEHRPR